MRVILLPLLTIERQFTSGPWRPLVRRARTGGRAAPGAGQAGACPYFLPEGPQRSPGSGPAAGRRAAVRSSLDAGGAAPYPRAARPPAGSAAALLVKASGGEAASFGVWAAQRPARGHAASFPASDCS